MSTEQSFTPPSFGTVARQLVAVVVALAVAVTLGISQQASAAEESPAGGSCPAVHMLLAPGTSETARSEDPNADNHGFLSKEIAKPLMDAANVGQIADMGAGFSDLLKDPQAKADDGNDNRIDESGDRSSDSPGSSSGQDAVQNVGRTYITYPSTAGGFWAGMGVKSGTPKNFGDTTSYKDSVLTGVEMTEDLMSQISVDCPDTKVFLTGYSQGAEVMSNVARKVGAGESTVDADTVAGVSLFADPTRAGGTPMLSDGGDSPGPVPGADGESTSSAVTGLSEVQTPEAGGLATDKSGIEDFGEISDRVFSPCLMGDYVCGLPADSELTNDIVNIIEEVDASDPIQALQQVSGVLDRAVSIGDMSEVADFDFGDGGFSTDTEAATDTPVLATQATGGTDGETAGGGTNLDSLVGGADTDSDSTESDDATDATESTDSADASEPSEDAPEQSTGDTAEPSAAPEDGGDDDGILPGGVNRTDGGVTGSGGDEPAGQPGTAPDAGQDLLGGDPLAGLENMGEKVVPLASGLGGIAMGAGMTVAKKTLTPENLSQIAMAGVTGGPEAAGATGMAKLSEAGMSLLEPGSASGYARDVLQVVEDSGIEVPEQVELAVSLSSWLSMTEHIEYQNRQILPDGRTATEATQDWVQAIAADMTGESESPVAAPEVAEALSGAAETGAGMLNEVDFNEQAADEAMDQLSELAVDTKEDAR